MTAELRAFCVLSRLVGEAAARGCAGAPVLCRRCAGFVLRLLLPTLTCIVRALAQHASVQIAELGVR